MALARWWNRFIPTPPRGENDLIFYFFFHLRRKSAREEWETRASHARPSFHRFNKHTVWYISLDCVCVVVVFTRKFPCLLLVDIFSSTNRYKKDTLMCDYRAFLGGPTIDWLLLMTVTCAGVLLTRESVWKLVEAHVSILSLVALFWVIFISLSFFALVFSCCCLALKIPPVSPMRMLVPNQKWKAHLLLPLARRLEAFFKLLLAIIFMHSSLSFLSWASAIRPLRNWSMNSFFLKDLPVHSRRRRMIEFGMSNRNWAIHTDCLFSVLPFSKIKSHLSHSKEIFFPKEMCCHMVSSQKLNRFPPPRSRTQGCVSAPRLSIIKAIQARLQSTRLAMRNVRFSFYWMRGTRC